jgi:syntaxin-binding protein 5
VSTFAYDPVQSLLAVGTNDSRFGPGLVYVFGQRRVQVTFNLPRRASVREIQFAADKLVVLDSKNDVSIFSLETKRMLANYAPPGHVVCMLTDPSLDYCFTGLQSGEIVAFDLDRENMTPLKIPNLWREMNPRARILPIVDMKFHPKDIGKLLIGYSEGAVTYSFKQNKAQKFFHYEIPRGAPGGDAHPTASMDVRHPRLTHVAWHPTGTFILTAHDDSSLAFWEPTSGRLLTARTVQEIDVNIPGSGGSRGPPGTPLSPTLSGPSVREPYRHISWCSKENPDDTGLLIAGGSPTTNPTKGLSFMDLGPTPVYQTSSWDALANHFRNPRRVHVLPTPPNTEVADVLIIPRNSPYYNGSHDPIAVLVIMGSGELLTMSFPSGHPISPTNQLSVDLTFIHPFVTKISLASFDRTRWLGLKESRAHGPLFVQGGREGTRPLKRFENRNVIQTAHADGTIRVWDAGHGDAIENGAVIQADLARALGRWDKVDVSQISMSGASGEMSVGLRSGEVVIFRFNRNKNAGRPDVDEEHGSPPPGQMFDISRRTDPGLKEGLLPLTMCNDQQGPVTALKQSDVGFVAVGYASGGITIIDLRGPAIIHTQLLSDLKAERNKRMSVRRSGSDNAAQSTEHATAVEFGVMTLEGDDYSSIALFVGTSKGRVITFKILPSSSGRYSAAFAGMSQISDDRVISINPIDSNSGSPAIATGAAVGGLQQGRRVDGSVVACTMGSAHIFKPAHSKGASKTFEGGFCDSAAVARYEERGYALVALFGDGTVRAFSLPGLKELGGQRINHVLDTKRFSDAIVTGTGDVIGFTGPSEIGLLNVFGSGLSLPHSSDTLLDPTRLIPPRPTISNLQWIAGTQYITPADLDLLIGGPDRPMSKRMRAQMQADQDAEFARQRQASRTGSSGMGGAQGAGARARQQEGWGEYMTRQIQERTEQLGLAGDSMDRAAEDSKGFSDSVSSYVAKQKRQAAMGYIGKQFGF